MLALKRLGKGIALVLRIVARTGYGAHIDKPLDAVRFKHCDEFRDRSRRVADGIYTQGQMVTALVAG
jgi:hypothetical protein